MQKKPLGVKALGVTVFIVLGLLLCYVYLKPFLGFSDTMLLRLDWHKEFQLTGATWISITKYHEFPLWNPYKSGGNFLFAHPESNVLSPETVFVLLFGPVKGLYVSVFFFYVLGFVGLYFVGRQLKITYLATAYLAVVFSFSSYVMNNLFMGASMWMMAGYIPFAFYFLLRAEEDWRYGIPAGFFHAMIYLGGAIYVYMLFIIFAAIFVLSGMIARRNPRYAKGLAALLVFSFLFAAVKIIPTFDLYAENPREVGHQTIPFGLDLMEKAFLDKHQAFDIVSAYTYKGENFHFPSYGDYIGIVPLVIGLLSAALMIKNIKWVLPLLGSLLLYLSNFGFFSFIWEIIHPIPPFTSLQRPARFVIIFALMLAIVGAFLISKIDRIRLENNRLNIAKKIVIALLVLYVFIDLTRASYMITGQFQPLDMPPNLVRFEEPFEYSDFYDRAGISDEEKRALDAGYLKGWAHVDTLSNKGSVKRAYDPIPIYKEIVVKAKGDSAYRGEYYLEGEGSISLLKRTTGSISLKVSSETGSILVINQNYHKAWKAKGFEVVDNDGLLGVVVPAGEHVISLKIFQGKIIIGSLLTLAGIVIGIYFLLQLRRDSKNSVKT